MTRGGGDTGVTRSESRIPFLRSLRGYTARDFGRDTIAAVLITATAIPLGVGFAQVAGLPPIVGLYTSVAPLIVYGLCGSSRHVKLGLDAAAAAMIGAVIVPLATTNGVVDESALLALAALVSILTGVILLVAGLARAGFVADLLSLPLLIGYQAGIGASVIIGQLSKLVGVPATPGSDVEKLVGAVTQLPGAHLPTVLIGCGSLVVLLVLRHLRPRWPAALMVLVLTIAGASIWRPQQAGIAVIGDLPRGLPAITVPDIGILRTDAVSLLGVSASLALVIASDVVIASRTFALRGRYRVFANTDLTGLGLAQIASGFTGGVTASASYVRTAIAENARSRTQVSSVLGGLLMAVVVALCTGALVSVPIAVLAAICVDACIRLIDVAAMRRLWRLRRIDVVIAAVTGVLVLAFDPLWAIAAAVVFSLASFFVRVARPDQSRLGRRAGMGGWWSMRDYPAAAPDADVVVYDWNGPLMFANAQTFRDRALALCGPSIRLLVVDCSAIFDIDSSAISVLEDMVQDLTDRRIDLAFAAPTPAVAAQLRLADVVGLGPEPHVFADVDTALAAHGKTPPPPGHLVDRDGDGVFEYVDED